MKWNDDVHTKILRICVLVALGTRLKVPILTMFSDFCIFQAFNLALALIFDTGVFTEHYFNLCTWSKKFLNGIKSRAKNQYNTDQIFAKSALRSGPYKVLFAVLLIRTTWNLVMTSPKNLMTPRNLVRILQPVLYFTYRHFIDLKISIWNFQGQFLI